MDREGTTLDELYHYFEEAANDFTAFAHIERELHKIDHCKYGDVLADEVKDFLGNVVLLAKENGIILELNESSLVTNESGAYDRILYWLTAAKENGNIISLGTDSHYCEEIGKFDYSLELLNRIDFPGERIINCNEELLNSFLCI